MVERIPPQNLDAEHAVLGAMLLHNDAIADVIPVLSADHFYKTANALLYDAIVKLYDEGQKVDLLILADHLDAAQQLQTVGGEAALMELVESVPSAANVKHYADIVREKAVQRMLIGVCNDIHQQAFEAGISSDELLDYAEREIFSIAEKKLRSESFHINDILHKLTEILESIRDREQRIQGVETGFYEMDDLLGGFKPGELIILAARPSMGKTTLALNIIDHVATHNRQGVLFFSVEMARLQVVQNMVCAKAGIRSELFRKGFISASDMARIIEGLEKLYDAKMFIDDTPGLRITELRAKARRMKAKHDIQLIVIDYLQLLSAQTGRNDSREQEISLVSRSLKGLARELEIPVVALAQLNRNVEGRTDHRPMLSDLRESGSIEQDADVVMFLTREDYYDPENEDARGRSRIIVAKQRNGPTGSIDLVFDGKHMRFGPLSKHELDEGDGY